MNQYSYEIHTPNLFGNWEVKETRNTLAFDEDEALKKAENFAASVYARFKIRNIVLVKIFNNPDNEI